MERPAGEYWRRETNAESGHAFTRCGPGGSRVRLRLHSNRARRSPRGPWGTSSPSGRLASHGHSRECSAASLVIGARADHLLRRRRSYAIFFLGVAAVGVVVATNPPLWLLFVVALTGTLSTDVVDNGAATTLEQVMLAAEDAGTGRVYGRYNAAGAACGAVGALAAA